MLFRKKLRVKPVSANEAWQLRGFRKFKSKKYKDYQHTIMDQLMFTEWPFDMDEKLYGIYRVGFSNVLSDLDNAIKPLQDTLSSIYGFNDNKIYGFKAKKIIVPKGKEYINVAIYPNKLS